jgi:hypothetical protein
MALRVAEETKLLHKAPFVRTSNHMPQEESLNEETHIFESCFMGRYGKRRLRLKKGKSCLVAKRR